MTPQEAFGQLMSDPMFAAQFAMVSLFNVAVAELVLAGTSTEEVHSIADVALKNGVPENVGDLSPWVFLLAYATVKFSKVAMPAEIHAMLDLMAAQAKSMVQQLGGGLK
jgi:hypothetical protein